MVKVKLINSVTLRPLEYNNVIIDLFLIQCFLFLSIELIINSISLNDNVIGTFWCNLIDLINLVIFCLDFLFKYKYLWKPLILEMTLFKDEFYILLPLYLFRFLM